MFGTPEQIIERQMWDLGHRAPAATAPAGSLLTGEHGGCIVCSTSFLYDGSGCVPSYVVVC